MVADQESMRRAAAFLQAYARPDRDLHELHILGPSEPEPTTETVWLDELGYPPDLRNGDSDAALVYGLAQLAVWLSEQAGWSRGRLLWALINFLSEPSVAEQ